jgi:hypothetical protein
MEVWMSPLEQFLLSLAASAAYQFIQYGFRLLACRTLPKAACVVGTLFLTIGEWLLKKGGLDVKPVLLRSLLSPTAA